MEKSRQRLTYNTIIDQTELKSPFRYLVEGSLTLFLWSVWVYWISPIVTALLWFLGITIFQTQVITKSGFAEFMDILRNGGLLALFITLVMLICIYYNYLWFLKRGERRSNEVLISNDVEIARLCDVDPAALQEIKGNRRIVVEIKDGKATLQ